MLLSVATRLCAIKIDLSHHLDCTEAVVRLKFTNLQLSNPQNMVCIIHYYVCVQQFFRHTTLELRCSFRGEGGVTVVILDTVKWSMRWENVGKIFGTIFTSGLIACHLKWSDFKVLSGTPTE